MAMPTASRVRYALACAALDPRLRGVLLFDLEPALLLDIGHWLGSLLGNPHPYVLGTSAVADNAWIGLSSRPTFGVSPGPLVDSPGAPPLTVLVSDLAKLSLTGQRAAITLLDADVAHLEREGLSVTWAPRTRWVAGCARADVGRIPPHLLDRFPLRVDASGLPADLEPPAEKWRHALAGGRLATVPDEVSRGVLGRTARGTAGARRDLALARIGRALATLDSRTWTTNADVEQAASLLRLPPPLDRGHRDDSGGGVARGRHDPEEGGGAGRRGGKEPSPSARADGFNVAAPAPAQPLAPGPVSPADPGGPYPEDDTEPERDPGSLRSQTTRHSSSRPSHGRSIGSRPGAFGDLAIVATILGAAPLQAGRCEDHYSRPPHPLHLIPPDLRVHRRSADPARLLVLVLDHTCRAGWNWLDALAPYLQWAYTGRAGVSVIEVGAAGVANELRAQRFSASSLLDPRVVRALERPVGRCTPLAHGLDLAVETLRHRLHLGRVPADDVLLVIVTDGRGNIPLRASATGELPDRVGSEGVEDALAMARELSRMKRIHAVVLDPGPRPGAALTRALAEACGARLQQGGEPR
ncbi:hypothetical protein OG884_08305 [Streptosporangium sp. NBC_01755]|uniref:hypothetical protein n=1 Tax=unclassified Streptosporangium TaxID=2632669 RepID=UPI002DDA1437|nr:MULTISPECIES: hypothetical protein [unclassified Streptosporangium]WSA26669.1 hypothetical protein OIE13_01855 [Streptosporangium sp. NBC_01810]WSD01907.1 hypothetical protein OG884_08305 [Streptosporangium sp. NBC_01755]